MGNHIVLSVWETISTAWAKLYGAKATIWAALIVFFLISIGFAFLHFIAEHIPSASAAMVIALITTIVAQAVQCLLQCGIYYLGIRRSADRSISYDMIFATFTWQFFWRVALLLFLISVIAYLPALIISGIAYYLSTVLLMQSVFVIGCIISGIWLLYTAIRLSICLGFAIEGVSAWESIKSSWHATQDNFFSILGIIILSVIIIAISAIPLGIGLIWTLPWSIVLYGVMYNRLKANVSTLIPSSSP